MCTFSVRVRFSFFLLLLLLLLLLPILLFSPSFSSLLASFLFARFLGLPDTERRNERRRATGKGATVRNLEEEEEEEERVAEGLRPSGALFSVPWFDGNRR